MPFQFMPKTTGFLLFIQNEEGQDLIEYALIVALIGIIAVASVIVLGEHMSTQMSVIASTLQSTL